MKKDRIVAINLETDWDFTPYSVPTFKLELHVEGTNIYEHFHKSKFSDKKLLDIFHSEANSILASQLFPDVKKVIFNNPATIVFWSDGTKTIVKCQEGDTFDQEKGLALCFMKKIYGNTGCFNDVFKKYVTEEKDDYAFTKFTNGFAKLTESLSNLASSMSLFGTGIDLNKSVGEKCIPIDSAFDTYEYRCIKLGYRSWDSFKKVLEFLDIDYDSIGINEFNYGKIYSYKHDKIGKNKIIVISNLLSTYFVTSPVYIVKNVNNNTYKLYSEMTFYENFYMDKILKDEENVKSNDLEVPEVKKCVSKSLYKPYKYNFCYIKITNTNWPSVKKLMEFLGIEYQLYGINGENYYDMSVYDSVPNNRNRDILLSILNSDDKSCEIRKVSYIVKNTVSHICTMYDHNKFSTMFEYKDE